MPSPATAHNLCGLPPGLKFDPTDEELVGVYLLRRARGQPDPFPGLIIDDDAAANTQPWTLFSRHGRSYNDDDDNVPAFFYVHTDNTKAKRADARQDRRCHGGGSWKSQKREREHELVVHGETVKWNRHNLNLHMDGRGSVGWVMREYTITTCPSLKICRISFTGHCKKRKFAPDGYDGAEPAPKQRPRVAAADDGGPSTSSSSCATTAFNRPCFLDAAQQDQEPVQQLPCSNDLAEMIPPPDWVHQERPCGAAVVATASSSASISSCATTAFDPRFLVTLDDATAQLPSFNELANMVPPSDWVLQQDQLQITMTQCPAQEPQQFDEQVPATTTMDAILPTNDDAVYWGGYQFV